MNRHEYMTSRPWGLLKRAVKERSCGVCERCFFYFADAVHHVTYQRLYSETLDDLLHLCKGCHEYVHGISDFNPMESTDYYREPLNKAHTLSINQPTAANGAAI